MTYMEVGKPEVIICPDVVHVKRGYGKVQGRSCRKRDFEGVDCRETARCEKYEDANAPSEYAMHE